MTPALATRMRRGDIAFAGVSDADERVRLIAYWIARSAMDPWSYVWTRETVRGLPPKDDAAEIRAVWARLTGRVRYTFHPEGRDVFQSFRQTWDLGAGDCDVMTIALCTALHLLGFRTGARIVSSDGAAWEHIYALVGLPRNNPTHALPLDPVLGPDGMPASARPGWQVPLEYLAAHRDFWFDFAPETR